MSRRRRPSKIRRLRAVIRLLTVFVLALFVGQTTLAYALPYIDGNDCGESCPEDDDRDCPCPLDCAKGCGRASVPGVPPTTLSLDVPLPVTTEAVTLASERVPPSVDPDDLLHVPKPLRA